MNIKIKLFIHQLIPRSLIQKCLLAIIFAMIGVLLLLQVIMNHWIYRQVEPALMENYSTLMSAVGTQSSYLLHQNTQYLKMLRSDENLMDALSKVPNFFDRTVQAEYKKELADNFPVETRGGDEPGAIVSSRSVIALVDWTEWVVTDEMIPYMERIIQSEWYEQLPTALQQLEADYENKIIKSYSPVFDADSENGVAEFVSLAMSKEWKGHEITFFMIEPFSEFRAIFQTFDQNQIFDYALVGHHLIFATDYSPVFSSLIPGNGDSLVTDKQYEVRQTFTDTGVVLGVRISYMVENLKLVVYIPHGIYQKPYLSFIRSVNFVLILLLAVLLLVILFVLRRNLSRLKILANQMDEIRQGKESPAAHIYGKDEIGILADNFYQMMDQIEENIAQIKRQEKREKEIEYSLLISQIDPHFIYNTLNTITYLAELNRYHDITVINRSLIEMLRDRLKISKLQIYDTISREEQQLQYYITIQNYLCGNRIVFQFYTQDPQLQYPKNILQPLVENSIFHGILLHRNTAGEKMQGNIQITVALNRNWIETEISDNGIGMSAEELHHYFVEIPESIADFGQSSKSHTHIGIYNIRMRLSYLYGESFQIFAKSPDHKGLTITLRFPLHVE